MKQSYLRIGLAFFGFILIGVSGGATGVLLPSMMAYYSVSNSIIGLLFFASSAGYFLSAFCSGFLLEKLGLRTFLIIGAITFLLGTLTFAVAPPFTILMTTRFLFGLGMAILETGLNAYVLSLPRNTQILNSLHAFYGAGALVGPITATAFLTRHLPWNSVYLLWSLLSLPLLLGFLFTFNVQPIISTTQKDHETAKNPVLVAALKLPVVWIVSLFLLFYVGVEVSTGNWSYTFLVEGQHQPIVLAGWIVSGYWLGLTVGRFTISAWAGRMGISNMHMIYGSMGGTLLGLLLIWFLPPGVGAALGFCLIGLAIGPIYPTTVAIIPTLVPQRLVSSAVGFLVSSSILGLAVFPWLAGILAQQTSTWSLVPYLGALTVVMLCFWWILFRIPSLVRDDEPSVIPTQSAVSNES